MSWYCRNATASRFGATRKCLDTSDATASAYLYSDTGNVDESATLTVTVQACTSSGAASGSAFSGNTSVAAGFNGSKTVSVTVGSEGAIPDSGGVKVTITLTDGFGTVSDSWYSTTETGAEAIQAGTHSFTVKCRSDNSSEEYNEYYLYYGAAQTYGPDTIFQGLAIPDAPTNLYANVTTGDVVLNWTKASGATGYKLYRGTSANPTTLYQTLGDVATYTDENPADATYYYRLKATNAAGDSTAYGNEIVVRLADTGKWTPLDGTNRFWLANEAAGYSPTAQGAWTSTSGSVTKALKLDRAGAVTTVGVAETSAAANKRLLGMFVGAPFPLDAMVSMSDHCFGIIESNIAADFECVVHAWVTAGDSSTVRGTLVNTARRSGEVGTDAATSGKTWTMAGNVAVSAGDRLVIEIGYAATNTSTTSYTGTLHYGGVSSSPLTDGGDATARPAWFDINVLPLWTGTQNLPRYIYDDRFTAMWTQEAAAGFEAYNVYIGAPGFDPVAASATTTITNAATLYYTATSLSAVTEYECYIGCVVSGVETFSRPRHVVTTAANECAIVQDGDHLINQMTFCHLATDDVPNEVVLGRRLVTADSLYALDTRSTGEYRHFNFSITELADPDVDGYYQIAGQTNGVTFGLIRRDTVDTTDGYYCIGDDERGHTWGDQTALAGLNASYARVLEAENGRCVTLSNGAVLKAFMTSVDFHSDSDIRVLKFDGTTWTDLALIYESGTITGVTGNEAVLEKISGTYPNETIICYFRPNVQLAAGRPYFVVSTDSGATWGSAAQSDFGTGVGNGYFGFAPPDIWYDSVASRLWMVCGHRYGTPFSNDGLYLAYNDTPTSATGWSTAAKVVQSGLAVWDNAGVFYGAQDYGHGTIIGVGDELWIASTQSIGGPRAVGGSSNPHIIFKAYSKANTPALQTLTKYTPATEPYAVPGTPTITAEAQSDGTIDLAWADVASDIGYIIQRKDTGAYADLDTAAADATGYTDATCVDGTTYTYKVKGIGLFVDGAYSNEASATAESTVLLEAADLAVITAIDSADLVQHHVLTAADLTIATYIDGAELTQHHVIVANDLAVVTVIDAVGLTQHHVLAAGDLVVVTTIDGVDLGAGIDITADDIIVITAIDTVTLGTQHKPPFRVTITATDASRLTLTSESGHRLTVTGEDTTTLTVTGY